MVGLVMVSVLLASACQRAMSVEEATKVAASVSDTQLYPPAPTIDDITAILEEQRVQDPEGLKALRAQAEEPDPRTRDSTVLAEFYFRRGVAKDRLGHSSAAIVDLEQALQHARKARLGSYRILAHLGWAEENGGSFTRAIDMLGQAAQAVPVTDRGYLFRVYATLIWTRARVGDLKAAEATLRELVSLDNESRSWANIRPGLRASWNAIVETGRAAIFEMRGELAKAEAAYRETRAHLGGDAEQAGTFAFHIAQARLGRVLIKQGRLLEAERETRNALLGALRRRGRYSLDTVILANYLVGLLGIQARYREQEALARAVLEIHEKLGTRSESLHLAYVRRHLAGSLLAQERLREALIELDAIRTGLGGQPALFKSNFGGDVGWGMALLDAGDHDGALRIFLVALDNAREIRGESDFSVGIARGAIAMAYRAKGDQARALTEFTVATRILLNTVGGATNDDEDRPATVGRLHARILVAYITILAEMAGTSIATSGGLDSAAEAFRIADVARAQSVQQALNAAAARAAVGDRALSDLVRQEQDARKRVTALEGTLVNLVSVSVDRQDQAQLTALRREVEVLRRARRTIAAEIKRRFPAYAQLIDPPPMTVDQVRATLRRGEALISTYVARDRTFVWAIPHTGSVTFAVAPLGERELEQAVRRLRAALDPNAIRLDQIPAFDVGLAHDLYRQVLEPVKAGWEAAERLLVVPHGPLGHLPFGVLVTQSGQLTPDVGALFSRYQHVPWLVRTHAITVLPSVTSLATLRALPPGDPSRRPFVGFGDPIFSEQQVRRAGSLRPPSPSNDAEAVTLRASPQLEAGQLGQLPRLPETAEEIRSIARAMNADPTQDVFLGVQANEKVVRTLSLSRYRVVVFATHGLVPGDLVGLTQPALALTAPEVAQIEGDGLLTMDEILGLRLNADWVVLSACNTASGNGAGSEAISGLGRAFFYAGARALLVSNWPVETTSAKWLTTELFRRQSEDPRRSRAEALRQTQNALIDHPGQIHPDTKQLVHSWAHPIFWAPFVLVGDGG